MKSTSQKVGTEHLLCRSRLDGGLVQLLCDRQLKRTLLRTVPPSFACVFFNGFPEFYSARSKYPPQNPHSDAVKESIRPCLRFPTLCLGFRQNVLLSRRSSRSDSFAVLPQLYFVHLTTLAYSFRIWPFCHVLLSLHLLVPVVYKTQDM